MSRWQFYDPVEDETLVFPQNPASMASMAQGHVTKGLATSPIDGVVRSQRAPDLPFAWSFTGKVRTKDDYDSLVAWVERPNRLHLTDHFGRVHSLLLSSFLPTPVEKLGKAVPWLFNYTMNALYYYRIS